MSARSGSAGTFHLRQEDQERRLPARRDFTFACIFDAVTFLPSSTLRGFFVISAAPNLTEKAGLLHLLFEQTQGEFHVVIFYLDNKHGSTNEATGVDAPAAVWQDSP